MEEHDVYMNRIIAEKGVIKSNPDELEPIEK